MKMNDVFPSKYLKAEDAVFANGEVTATIKDVSMEEMQGKNGKESKAVMFFREVPKGLVINKTNWKTCAGLYGEDSDEWIGSKIVMAVVDSVAYGDPVRSITIVNKKPAGDRTAMLKRYSELFEKAKTLGVENVESYAIPANITDAELLALGKELRAKVDAAENF